MNRVLRLLVSGLVLVLAVILGGGAIRDWAVPRHSMRYSELLRHLEDGSLRTVRVERTFLSGAWVTRRGDYRRFRTCLPLEGTIGPLFDLMNRRALSGTLLVETSSPLCGVRLVPELPTGVGGPVTVAAGLMVLVAVLRALALRHPPGPAIR